MEPADIPVFFEQHSDPVARELADVPERDRAAYEDNWLRILGDDTVLARAIVRGDEVLGHAISFVLEGKRMVGYWIGREHWGRGIASEAFAQFLELEMRRPLYARVATHNAASLRVLEKAGFATSTELPDGFELVLR